MVKTIWNLTEEELLAGSLTSAKCDRCDGRGTFLQTVIDCHDSALQEAERMLACDCRQRPAELWQKANLPAGRFEGVTLADMNWGCIEPSESSLAVRDFASHLELWMSEGMGLTLTGNVGTGKTHIAVGLIKLACGLGVEARFLTMAELLGAIKATYDRGQERAYQRNGNGRINETDLLDAVSEVPLLALDDLGTEKPTSWLRDRLYTVINRRYMAQRPIIVTTNLSLGELAERLGERIVSRVWGTSLVVNLRGEDYREMVKREALIRIRARAGES